MELKKLLYAVDLEDAPHPAIEHVKMVASLTGASVSIVYVLPSETVYESNYLSGEGQPNRIAPTQALLEKMEHFLNTNFPEGVDDCAFLMGKISEEVVIEPYRDGAYPYHAMLSEAAKMYELSPEIQKDATVSEE